jgi:hypothetical protein
VPIHFTGFDGFYEIFNPNYILHRKLNQMGKVTFSKNYKSISDIPNKTDREKIFEILFGKNKLVSQI